MLPITHNGKYDLEKAALLLRETSELQGFPGGSVLKNLATNAADSGDGSSIPGLGRFHGGGNGNPHHYSCLENPMDRGAWWPTIHGIPKSQTRLGK